VRRLELEATSPQHPLRSPDHLLGKAS